jgi:hypothetical protein
MNLPELTPPHCDQAVLHAPGECRFCDDCPEWQALRVLWGIAFTGHVPQELNVPKYRQLPCPSDFRRPGGINQVWPGNWPQPEQSA